MPNSNLKLHKQIDDAVATLNRGGIIAYPTEAVFGLGCDPFDQQAVMRLLALKHRSISKGLILIADTFEKLAPLTKPITPEKFTHAKNSWPGPVTWAFPASRDTPPWIRGDFNSIAIRVTDHPIASKICAQFAKPIVSTSANIEGAPPATSPQMVRKYFLDNVDVVIDGSIGTLLKPTPIYDIMTGQQIR